MRSASHFVAEAGPSARAAELIARGPLGLDDVLAAAFAETIGAAAAEAGLGEWPDPRAVLDSLAEVRA